MLIPLTGRDILSAPCVHLVQPPSKAELRNADVDAMRELVLGSAATWVTERVMLQRACLRRMIQRLGETRMTDKYQPPIEDNRDLPMKIARGALGAVPYVGSLLQEIGATKGCLPVCLWALEPPTNPVLTLPSLITSMGSPGFAQSGSNGSVSVRRWTGDRLRGTKVDPRLVA